jgi:hypothetical protein
MSRSHSCLIAGGELADHADRVKVGYFRESRLDAVGDLCSVPPASIGLMPAIHSATAIMTTVTGRSGEGRRPGFAVSCRSPE